MIPGNPDQLETPPIPDTLPTPRVPFWDFLDLGFLISLCLPALLVSVLLVRAISQLLPPGKPFQGLLVQLVWYGLVFGSLAALLHLRYRQPFWRSLGWKFRAPSAVLSFFIGPLLAIAVGLLGAILRTPEIPLPFQQMFDDRRTMLLFALFVVVLGPLCEELAFRGFLMPLLVRSLGAASGIVVTGLLFGSLHGYEYSWSWRHMLLITIAGTVFGWVRYKTGSTAASTFMHSSYNLMQFGAFLAQSRNI
jgi:membrane protease YdiL (CAAX protease family)